MSVNLLILYEIADKASRVKSKRAFREFERWLKQIVSDYKDAAIQRVANMYLFRLREQFAY